MTQHLDYIKDLPTAAPENARLIDPTRLDPGSREDLRAAKDMARQTFGENIAEGFKLTALHAITTKIQDEGLFGLVGFREEGTPLDRNALLEQFPPEVSRRDRIAILAEPTLEAAMRHQRRVVDEVQLGQRMAAQPIGMGFAAMIGSAADIDMPLNFMTGGSLAAARLARGVFRLGRSARLTERASTRLASTVVGFSGGAQAGALVGLAEQGTKETATFEDFADMMLMSTAFGTVMGGASNSAAGLANKAAMEEFYARVARDDPNLRDELDVDSMDPTSDALGLSDEIDPDTLVIGGGEVKGVGAEVTGATGQPRVEIKDPHGPIGPDEAKVLESTQAWAHESDFNDKKSRDARTIWIKAVTSRLGRLGTEDFVKLYTSGSSALNWLGGVVFESSSGLNRGRGTAAIRMEMYHHRIMQFISSDIESLVHTYARDTNSTWARSGYGVSQKGHKAFNRELMLEMSRRARKQKGDAPQTIVEAADRYETAGKEARSIAKGRDGQRSIDGAEHWEDKAGYTPYSWAGQEIERLIKDGVKHDDITAALADGYRAAGMLTEAKDALAVAKAVVQRAMARSGDIDSSMQSLLSGDGRAFMRETLALTSMKEAEIDILMDRLTGNLEERSKPGFVKSRNEIDMSIQIKNSLGRDIRLVDLLDQDMGKVWQKYTRQVSGAAALARVGITNKAQRAVFIRAAQAEQRSLGEKVMPTDLLEAMFSHFNGGPVHGFAAGSKNEGINMITAIAKRIANLGLLEKLGITQLGESGATMARLGLVNYWERSPIAAAINATKKAENKVLLDDLAYVMGEVGNDQRHYGEWRDRDEISTSDRAEWIKTIDRISGNAALVQSYTSFFNTVRKHQQQIAVMGIVDKVMRAVRKGEYDDMLNRFENDLGLGREELNAIESLVNSGVVEFGDKGQVIRVNFDKWDAELAETFGSAVTRNVNQIVQKSSAGEQAAWMHTEWGTIMTHLKTFPLQAIQKQMLRNLRHFDGETMATMLMGLSTAMIAVQLRDIIDGRDRSLTSQAAAAFNYNNMTGWFGLVADPAFSMMGLDDLRTNPYGPYSSLVPPVLTQWDNLYRAPGALLKGALGGGEDYFDRQAKKAIPFAGTLLISRMFDKAKPSDGSRPSGLRSILENEGVAAAIKAGDASRTPSKPRPSGLRSILENADVAAAIKAGDG